MVPEQAQCWALMMQKHKGYTAGTYIFSRKQEVEREQESAARASKRAKIDRETFSVSLWKPPKYRLHKSLDTDYVSTLNTPVSP